MAYKSALTILTDQAALARTLDAAVAVARQAGAHLDVLCLGVDRTQFGYAYEGAAVFIQQQAIERARLDAEELQAAAHAALEGVEISWGVEAMIVQLGSLSAVIGLRSRFADLAILPRPYGEGRVQEAEAVLEAALFEGRAPVLVLPAAPLALPLGRRIVLGWNESDEALSAARKALPLLIAADHVEIAVIDPPRHAPDRADPGVGISQWLARHGAKAQVSVLPRTLPRVSEVLIRHARDVDADLLVMGAYGHSRFREAILGGATRDMLEKAGMPVLMAH